MKHQPGRRSSFWGRTAGLFLLALAVGAASDASRAQEITIEFGADDSLLINWNPISESSVYVLESTDSLSNPWRPIPRADFWPIKETQYRDVRNLVSHRFYRIQTSQPPTVDRGRLISFRKRGDFSAEDMSALLRDINLTSIKPSSDVDYYRVVYETVDVHGESTVATGAVIIPTDFDETLPLFGYQHRTTLLSENVPSRANAGALSSIVMFLIASTGFVVTAPDYPGLGDSEDVHPYLLAKGVAAAATDILPAAQSLLESRKVDTYDEVYLMGYGEGGYVALATQRALESDPDNSLEVIASTVMSGPYDPSAWVLEHILDPDNPFPSPGLLLRLLVSYNDRYGIYDDPREVFTRDARSALFLLDGSYTLETVNSRLPRDAGDMFQPAFLEALLTEEDHPLRLALEENRLNDWAPQGHLRMYHCSIGDRTIPYFITERTFESLYDQGGNVDPIIDHFPILNHQNCFDISFTSALLWLLSIRN